MMDMNARHALITGGLGSIGAAFALAFADAGVRITILDRPGATPPAVHGWLGIDLDDLSVVQARVAAAGPFDILINNAALIINKPFEDFSIEEYETQLRVNSASAFALARACAPGMKAKGWGRIINLTSLTLNGQWEGFVPYVASKGALLGLTKGLARELGPHGITVNAIAPGAVVSDAERRVFADRLEEYNSFILERQCIKARIEPRDVANLALFLASDAAGMITGQNIGIDGGW
ncbi:MAG: SDR family oxidoreductase [Rhodobacter sp.]|nr:SDR family oxidoreductase [Rhodobacter sp.]